MLLLAVIVAAGCRRGDSGDSGEPYAEISRQEKIEMIERDPKLTDFEKYSKLAELEKQSKGR